MASGATQNGEDRDVDPAPGGRFPLDVVGLGEISLDATLELATLPEAGGKQSALAERQGPGGQIATAVLGCARLGLRAGFVGAIGDDGAAEQALAPLREAGVELSGVQRVRGARTRRATILVERARGERSVIERRDGRVTIDPAAVDPVALASARALLVDGSDPEAALVAARAAATGGAAVFLDADGDPAALEKLLPRVDFPVVSQRFAEEIGGGVSVVEGLEVLCRAGARVAVATLGDRGAIARSRGRDWCSPAFRIEPRDTTGAGDAFHAAWIAEMLSGTDLERALRTANAAAAMNCREPGAQGGLPTREALAAFLREQRQDRWRGPR